MEITPNGLSILAIAVLAFFLLRLLVRGYADRRKRYALLDFLSDEWQFAFELRQAIAQRKETLADVSLVNFHLSKLEGEKIVETRQTEHTVFNLTSTLAQYRLIPKGERRRLKKPKFLSYFITT